MNRKVAVAGNAGPKVRSDCEITLILTNKGGIKTDLASKVKTLYGESIVGLCKEVLKFFEISHAELKINDSGALPFVIAARLEAAIKELKPSALEYLPEMIKESTFAGIAGRTRFSRLYIPGNTPSMMINAGLHSADGIILDLEDSVAPLKKDEARILVRNALRSVDFRGAERMVRINQGKTGYKDLQSIVPHNVNLVLVPKCETRENIERVEKEIAEIQKRLRIKNRVLLMPIIESALGIENSFSIATSSENVVAIAIGLEDFTTDLGVPRTVEGRESLYARTRMVVAAKAAGIQPVDSVFSDVGDMDALMQNVLNSKSLGFEGMGCIHPRQVPVINRGFAPDDAEISKSVKIVLAWEEAEKKGLGVIAIGTKMIDQPVVTRARKTIDLAIKLNRLAPDWRETNSENMNQ
jgi:citrate lyase subunit beta/citryl-CoA lyase